MQAQAILQLAAAFAVDTQEVAVDLRRFVESPHMFGSDAQKLLADYIVQRVTPVAHLVRKQDFVAETPNPHINLSSIHLAGPQELTVQTNGANIFAFWGLTDAPKCVVLLGSHYDTKHLAHITYVGANDSGSSSVLLMELMRFVRKRNPDFALQCDIASIWFDGEEAILPNWDDGVNLHPAKIQDNTYGSRFAVRSFTKCAQDAEKFCLPQEIRSLPVVALILLDMVGSRNVKISRDENTPPKMQALLIKSLDELQLSSLLSPYGKAIADDHTPFLAKGIPALNLIDFENLSTWHNHGDTYDSLDLNSLQSVGKVALHLGLSIAQQPQLVQNR